jgi:hypothetical protein
MSGLRSEEARWGIDKSDNQKRLTSSAAQRRGCRRRRRTMRRLLDAGLQVFAARLSAARVDGRASRTHVAAPSTSTSPRGSSALAVECAHDLTEMAGTIGPIGPATTRAELGAPRGSSLSPVAGRSSAWMEDQVDQISPPQRKGVHGDR